MQLSRDELYNERELLFSIAKSDEAAFEKLFRRYRDRIYSVAFKLTYSTTIAEEIVQDIFMKVWTKRADLIHIENFQAYLFVITRNNVYKVLRRIAGTYKITSLAAEEQIIAPDNTTDLVMEKEYSLLLRKAIDRLPNQQKKIYTLIKDEGLKRDEVAHLLHLRPETVKFHLSEAMKNIRSFCLLHLDLIIALAIGLPWLAGE